MEASRAPGIPAGLDIVARGSAVTEADNMDIDMDIDLGPTDDKEFFQSVRGELSNRDLTSSASKFFCRPRNSPTSPWLIQRTPWQLQLTPAM